MRKKTLLLFLLVLSLLLTSCAHFQGNADTMLSKLLALSGEAVEDGGYIFTSVTDENDVGYMSDEYKNMLYSQKATETYFPKIEEFAIFVSSRSVGELAVFRCYSSSDTDLIVEMCLERADSLKIALRGTQWEEKSKNILISVSGRCVLFCFCENMRSVEKEFLSLT